MAILNFHEITKEHKYIGGKAYHLAKLFQQSLPVPNAIVITNSFDLKDHEALLKWWKDLNQPPLAIRSSANDEDGSDYSFAGQNSSFLNITTKEELFSAVKKCFDSINNDSSLAYRKRFLGGSSKSKMNVLIQQMVSPLFAGVYFSENPLNKRNGDLIEYVEGLGESLVSGKKTPFKIENGTTKKSHPEWTDTFTKEIQLLGKRVKDYLTQELDMEWAIDKKGNLFLLQARPITTSYIKKEHEEAAINELKRIQALYPSDTSWDGQTFSEWTGIPSQLSYSIFKDVFSNNYSYGHALKYLGYEGFDSNHQDKENQSVLDLVFGRAFINLNRLKPLFFGDIPYQITPKPSPHLKFDWHLITWKTILRTPISIYKMMKVGWSLSSNRSKYLAECQKELGKFQQKMERPINKDLYTSWSNEELLQRFGKEIHVFAKYHLQCPLVLTILIESTYRSLIAITKSLLGDEAENRIKHWMSVGLHTATYEMKDYYEKACRDPKKREFFMSKYGHRAAGELDLRNPRWIELGDKAFISSDKTASKKEHLIIKDTVIEEIRNLHSFKKTIIEQEWKLLKSMLELREQWKMSILKPFAEIRFLCLEIAKRSQLTEDIYYLKKEEILDGDIFNSEKLPYFKDIIKERKKQALSFSYYSMPNIVSIKQIENLIFNRTESSNKNIKGDPISPGLVFGKIKVIRDIKEALNEDFDDNTIIVAETTDPGWTPIFTKAKGIIVEKGGALSHSAIVAREMGIPAVSSVENCMNQFKDGDLICLNGNNGQISYE